MVNYSPEDLEQWLREKPERKEGLYWLEEEKSESSWYMFLHWKDNPKKFEELIGGHLDDKSFVYKPYTAIGKKWKAEVDDKREHSLFFKNLKKEIEELKAQLKDYESLETTSNPNEPLNTKIQRKRQELQQAITGNKKSTALLRKEIELLERIQTLENKVKDLETKETNYKNQIQQKEQTINQKQTELNTKQTQLDNRQEQITNLTNQKTQLETQLQTKTLSEQQFKTKSTNLQTQLTTKTNEFNQAQTKIISCQEQINSLTAEKQALEEKMLSERQTALNTFNQEKEQLTKDLEKIKEQKDTFQKSADYLRETLKSTEKTLEDIKNQLAQAQNDQQSIAEDKDKLLTNKEEELRQRNEAFKVISERNTDLTNKLSQSSSEIDQLTQWIGKLESASVEGDAFINLKKDLAQAQTKIQELQEQLNTKQPKSYWWIYVVVALIGIYFIVK